MLHQHIEFTRKTLVELADDSSRDSVAKPAERTAIRLSLVRVPDLIRDERLEVEITYPHRMVDLESISVDIEIGVFGRTRLS